MSSGTATIKPEKILKELSDLWTQIAAPEDSGKSQAGGVLRACAMTMVVIAEESDDTQTIGETLAKLMKEHPSRAIVIRLRKSDEAWLQSNVFAQCWKPFGGRQEICCEQIEIIASDSSLPDVAAVVLPLVVADLPVILWCRSGRATELAGFAELAALAQKVICDSASFPDQRRALSILLNANWPGVRLADLAWGRLTRARELLAQAVNSEDLLESLRGADLVRVRARGSEPEVPARYFVSWLSNRLARWGAYPRIEWEFEGGDAPASITGLWLHSPDGFTLVLSVRERVSNGFVVDLVVNERPNCAVLLRPSEYELLLQELSIPGRDVVYEAALRRSATV